MAKGTTTTTTTTTTASKAAAPSKADSSPTNALSALWTNYEEVTPTKLKIIDSFLAFIMLSGVIQFVYCVLISNFPYNAFLAGFSSCIGQFVLTASLRSQVNPLNREQFKEVSPERAFADFAMGSIVLHFFVFNFLG